MDERQYIQALEERIAKLEGLVVQAMGSSIPTPEPEEESVAQRLIALARRDPYAAKAAALAYAKAYKVTRKPREVQV